MAVRADRLPSEDALASRYSAVRDLSVALAAPLSDADASAQAMPDASPAKWHLAHTSWFFETFILRDGVPGYRLFDERWPFLFNSYYEAEGERMARGRRGMLTRPSLDEALAYRANVDAALIAAIPNVSPPLRDLVSLGCHHEEQHQELLLMDALALFAENPLCPAMWEAAPAAPIPASVESMRWIERPDGIVEIGRAGDGFAFDCEGPRHTALLHRHALADRLVTNGEWQAFIADGGYATPGLWLSDGWSWVQSGKIAAPLYWRQREGQWLRFGLDGLRAIDPAAPVAHISFYEADAFARWAGARLPTEMEWESSARGLDPGSGNQLDGPGAPSTRAAAAGSGLRQMFGDVWQWTASAFLPYPGFTPAEGAVGEYNGKFMSGQCVLRGASCATPRGHSRASYRNFFYPHQRWQFAGLRLAKDL